LTWSSSCCVGCKRRASPHSVAQAAGSLRREQGPHGPSKGRPRLLLMAPSRRLPHYASQNPSSSDTSMIDPSDAGHARVPSGSPNVGRFEGRQGCRRASRMQTDCVRESRPVALHDLEPTGGSEGLQAITGVAAERSDVPGVPRGPTRSVVLRGMADIHLAWMRYPEGCDQAVDRS
jgi:hypothetical protein